MQKRADLAVEILGSQNMPVMADPNVKPVDGKCVCLCNAECLHSIILLKI